MIALVLDCTCKETQYNSRTAEHGSTVAQQLYSNITQQSKVAKQSTGCQIKNGPPIPDRFKPFELILNHFSELFETFDRTNQNKVFSTRWECTVIILANLMED